MASLIFFFGLKAQKEASQDLANVVSPANFRILAFQIRKND